VKGVLSKDMATVSEYLQMWKLKLGTTKTEPAAFHLNNKEGKRALKVKYNNETYNCFEQLTFHHHLCGFHKLPEQV